MQRNFDLVDAMVAMGDARRQTAPVEAATWYRRSMSALKSLNQDSAEVKHEAAILDEDLAEVLPVARAAEQHSLLQQNRSIRAEQADKTPHGLLHLMSADCELGDAELAAGQVERAAGYLREAMPLAAQYHHDSPSLLVLRNVGLCLRTDGSLHLRRAMSTTPSHARKEEAEAAVQQLEKSHHIWSLWSQRGASSPESIAEAKRVEALLSQARILSAP